MTGKPNSTVIAAFQDRLEAKNALDELRQAGFDHQDIGLAMRGDDVAERGMITDEAGAKDAKGAAAGAATGAGIGALIGAGAAILVPGIGPVLAGGILAAAIGGAAAGAAVGGIAGAMAGLGVSEEEAKFYEEEFSSGRAIVAVKAGDRRQDATQILRKHGGYDFQTRRNGPVKTEGYFSEP